MSTPTIDEAPPAPEETDVPFAIEVRRPRADVIYRAIAYGGGVLTLLIMALIGYFLLSKALPALRVAKFSFLTEQRWVPQGHHFGIKAVLLGTFLIAAVAMVIAIPVAIGSS